MSAVGRLVAAPRPSQAERDATEFARVLAKNWEGGLLVARSAESQQGRRLRALSAKLTLRAFAKVAGVSDHTVRRYLDAWGRAADAGLVPQARELEPGQDVDLTAAKAHSWDDFYSAPKQSMSSLQQMCAELIRVIGPRPKPGSVDAAYRRARASNDALLRAVTALREACNERESYESTHARYLLAELRLLVDELEGGDSSMESTAAAYMER